MVFLAPEGKTPVKVQLTTKITMEDEIETYELTVFGHSYQKGTTIYLKYDEIQEQGTIHTVVKIAGEEAVIIRSGLIKMRLNFSLNGQRNGSYDSSYGTLFLTTHTKMLQHHQEADGIHGQLRLAYDLTMQGSTVGHYEMNINYKEDMVTNEHR